MQGYFGGRVDLIFQRFLEIWSSIPSLFVLIIISSVLCRASGRCSACSCSSTGFYLVGVVRAEFLRGRNFEYITGGPGAGSLRRQDHVQALAAERHGGDADVPALQAVGLDHGA
jgi:microcin C transport system permease protein